MSKPHIWLSVVRSRKNKWACCTSRRSESMYGPGRFLTPYPHGIVVYGDTPTEAYNNWKEHHVGSA